MEGTIFSVRYIPSRQVFVALGFEHGDVFYRFSSDLMHWGAEKSLLHAERRSAWKSTEPGTGPQWYYSLLDPTSSSSNFDTLERRPYLYYVKYRVADGARPEGRRDLVRVPLRIE